MTAVAECSPARTLLATAARTLHLAALALGLGGCPTPAPTTDCAVDRECPTGYRCLGTPPSCVWQPPASSDAARGDATALDGRASEGPTADSARSDAASADRAGADRPADDASAADLALADHTLDAQLADLVALPDLGAEDQGRLEASGFEASIPDLAVPDLWQDVTAASDQSSAPDLGAPDLAVATDQAQVLDATPAGLTHVVTLAVAGVGPLDMVLTPAQSGDLALFALAYEDPQQATVLSISGLCNSLTDVYDSGPADLPLRQFWCWVDLANTTTQVSASLRTDSSNAQLPILFAVSVYRGASADPVKSTSASHDAAATALAYGVGFDPPRAAGDRLYGALFAIADSHVASSPTVQRGVADLTLASGQRALLAILERAVVDPAQDTGVNGTLAGGPARLAFYLRGQRLH